MMAENKQKNRSMWEAVKSGDLDKIKLLLSEDPAYIHKVTPFGTWLHVAASSGQLKLAEYFLENGIDINADSGIYGGNALNEAAQEGHADMVVFLLDRGSKFDVTEPERNALFSAIHHGHTDVAKILIEAGIDTSVRYTGSSMKNMGALEFAKERGHPDTIKYIESVIKNA